MTRRAIGWSNHNLGLKRNSTTANKTERELTVSRHVDRADGTVAVVSPISTTWLGA